MTAPRTIALFGGSFNPPHVAHQMACLLVLETQDVDELWMVPTYRHVFAKHLVAFEERYRMCELAAAALGARVAVSRIEAELDQPVSRTLDTVHALARRHPDCRFRLVVGADILAETGKWHRWDEVVRLAPPIIVGRRGHAAPGPGGALPGMPAGTEAAGYIQIELPRVSSTEVRERISRGQTVAPLVPRRVMNYIAERGLYRDDTDT